MGNEPEERQRLQEFFKKAESATLSTADLIVEAWHTLSWKSFLSICGALLALCSLGFSLGVWWMRLFSQRPASQQPTVPLQQVADLSIVKCTYAQDTSRLPGAWARLLGDHIDIVRQDTRAAKFSRLFVLESGTLDHSYGFGWTLEAWSGSPSYGLLVSTAYLDQEIEGHESFSPLKVVRNVQRFRVEVPDVKSSGRIIVLVALSGDMEISDECTHLVKVSKE